MKYNQPFGITDPNAPYINGDPQTGTMGSIPPAASIEYPQREIVAAISSAVLADRSGPLNQPDNADLMQLAKAVQSMLFNSARDTGVTNNLACNLSPPIISYFEGLEVTLKIANTNTGPAVLNINSVGNRPVTNPDGSPITPHLLNAGAWVKFKYDGVNFQVVWASGQVLGAPAFLLAPATFYVNVNTGNDGWDGTTAAYTTGAQGPFKTLQRAANEVTHYNLNNYSITINVADGTYAPFSMTKYSGSGIVYWKGNLGNPAACVIVAGNNQSCMESFDFGVQQLEGFKLNAAGPGTPGQDVCSGIFIGGNAHLMLGNLEYGTCYGGHLLVSRSSQCTILSGCTQKISGPPQGITWSSHATVFFGGNLECPVQNPPTMTVIAPMNLGGQSFIHVSSAGIASYLFGGGFGGAANVSNAQRYYVESNGIINTLGGGPNYFPGTIAGAQATGGQYG